MYLSIPFNSFNYSGVDRHCNVSAGSKLSKQENLKEMGDVSSGMASTVIQLYLKEILESFVHPNVGVRQAALRVIQLILSQGLVHPVQVSNFHYCSSPRVVVNSGQPITALSRPYPCKIEL